MEEEASLLALYKVEIEKQELLQKKHAKEDGVRQDELQEQKNLREAAKAQEDMDRYLTKKREEQREEMKETAATKALISDMQLSLIHI